MSDLFISYSRKDKVFAQKLYQSLTQSGKSVWVDWEDIPQAADWRAEIQQGIEEAHAVVFVVSPDFLVSMECMMELEVAEEFNKRLIPLIHRDVDPKIVPPSLAALNWIFIRDSDDFDQATKQLTVAIDTDLDWVKTHTRLTRRTLEWETSQRNDSYLLRGDDLAEAVQYLSQQKREPALTRHQQEYIVASQEKQAADLRHELNQARQLRQRLWLAVGLLATVLVVGIFAIFTAVQNGTLRVGTNEVVDTIVSFSDAQTNSDICWGGALQGLVEEVMPACEMALLLEPDGPVYFESRGLARALQGDYAAGAADFRAAASLAREFGENEDNIPDWEAWAQSLEQGQNPFDETLKQQLLVEWEEEKQEFNK